MGYCSTRRVYLELNNMHLYVLILKGSYTGYIAEVSDGWAYFARIALHTVELTTPLPYKVTELPNFGINLIAQFRLRIMRVLVFDFLDSLAQLRSANGAMLSFLCFFTGTPLISPRLFTSNLFHFV